MIRTLKPDEPTPSEPPRRYRTTDGYWRLRWRIGPGQYVERLEHRAVIVPAKGQIVHHRNGDRLDNAPNNLEPMDRPTHSRHHNRSKADPAELAALYAEGFSTVELGER